MPTDLTLHGCDDAEESLRSLLRLQLDIIKRAVAAERAWCIDVVARHFGDGPFDLGAECIWELRNG